MNHTYFNRKKKTNGGFRHNGSTTAPLKTAKPVQPVNGKKKAVSTLNPDLLIKSATAEPMAPYAPTRAFNEMPIHPRLMANITRKRFTHPTRIQNDTFEALAAGRDVLGIANTGTGKTGAFLIPIIDLLLKNSQPFNTLVVVPTRELALQVEEEAKSLARGLGIHTASFIGGTSVGKDMEKLSRNNQIIIGTPGRLLDLYSRGVLHIKEISTLVLDEFDRMLDMGFINDIKKIVRAMTRRKHTMLFSATMDHSQKSLIDGLLNHPVEVKACTGATASEQVEQDIIRVPQGGDKFSMLLELLNSEDASKALIFAETKRAVDKLSKKLNQSGVKAEQIHGNKSQNYRINALNKFKSGSVQALVATDVASRGIDVSDITHVINYQLPMNLDAYIHRIGRTGRAGKTGKAFTFVD